MSILLALAAAVIVLNAAYLLRLVRQDGLGHTPGPRSHPADPFDPRSTGWATRPQRDLHPALAEGLRRPAPTRRARVTRSAPARSCTRVTPAR